MTKRSRIENKELIENVRFNGRIEAAFRRGGCATAYANQLKEEYPESTIEISDQYGCTLLTLLPRTVVQC